MRIDQETGQLFLPEMHLVVSATLQRSQFLSDAFSNAPIFVQNEPWCSYRLPSIQLADSELTTVLQFHGETLVAANLSHETAQLGSGWTDWSQERELARQAFHQRWLNEALDLPPGNYPWGAVYSGYDPKGGFSLITISYHSVAIH